MASEQPGNSPESQTADILAHAAAEAADPGADTENAYECPFCVMMRKGGCEDPFKAFMACGEKADKGEMEMADCLKEFEALNKCMEKNKDMFDDLLGEMKEEEERAKQQQEASSSSNAEAAAAAATAGGATTHSAAEQPPQSHTTHGAAAAGTSHADSAAQPATTSSGHSQGPGVPATV